MLMRVLGELDRLHLPVLTPVRVHEHEPRLGEARRCSGQEPLVARLRVILFRPGRPAKRNLLLSEPLHRHLRNVLDALLLLGSFLLCQLATHLVFLGSAVDCGLARLEQLRRGLL